ncbi:hypothetical protein N8Z76_00515 [Gammaproteobacteria bacterium]|nr:hypothetical protein [Gammaproteobacteria bacterium]
MNVGKGYGAHYRGIIFDQSYKNLDDLISKSKRWFYKFNDGAKFLSSMSDLKWVWPTGEELLFRHMEKPKDYEAYHGHEYPFIGWNELTKWGTSEVYDLMMSCNRSSFLPSEHSPDPAQPIPEIPLTVFATTNPFGPGHNWVKRKFITPAEAGEVIRTTTQVYNPRTEQEEDITKSQVRIFSLYEENRYLAPEYVAELVNISDPSRKAAWFEGNWDITAGGAFDDIWREGTHVVPRFPIPANWKVTRSFDWGSTHPFSVGWWAVANGEEIEVNGQTLFFPKGSLIRCHEYYGSKKVNGERFGHNQGQVLSARKIAMNISKIEANLQEAGMFKSTPEPGPADNQISNVNEDESWSIVALMSEVGIEWTSSDKSKGSRKNGFELMRNAMESSISKEGPGLYIMKHCEAFIETVPHLPRDEKDMDDIDCWVAGTKISTPQGERDIENIREGDIVDTPIGPRPVIASYYSADSETVKVKLKNGVILEGTPDHKVFVEGKGLVELVNLDSTSVLVSIDNSCLKELNTKESFTQNMMADHITHPMGHCLKTELLAYTGKYGRIAMGIYQKAFIFITKTQIQRIMTSQILRQFQPQNMQGCITWPERIYGKSLLNGEKPKRGKKHYERMQGRCVKMPLKENLRVQIVESLLRRKSKASTDARNVQMTETKRDTLKRLAQYVRNYFVTKRTKQNRSKLAVQSVVGCSEKKGVYNLTVLEAHLFYANGILSANTTAEDHVYDEARYMFLDRKPEFATSIKLVYQT